MKIKIHPLFYATLLFCALFGGLTVTLICLVTALLHECGHVFCAAKMGFECEKIKIMPYGAAAVCDLEGIRAGDEIKLALAGPAVNAAICVAVAGLWWFFPQTYAYTDTVMHANVAMLVVNLLPAYPLDGGRVLGCALTKFFGKRVSRITLKVIALVCAAGLTVWFFLSGYNPTLIIFALFLVFSAIEKAPRAELINFASSGKLKRGMEVKYVLCDNSLTYRQAFSMLDDKRYLVLQLYGEDGVADEITQDELYAQAALHSFYDPVFGEESGAFGELRALEDGEEGNLLEDGEARKSEDEADYLSRNERENISGESLPLITAPTQSAPNETASSTAPESEA